MEKHSLKEDWIAILTGTFLVAQGVFFLQSANLLTGGTTGLALLISQFTPFTFGVLYFLANSPFYLLAWKRFGRHFAINSAISARNTATYLPLPRFAKGQKVLARKGKAIAPGRGGRGRYAVQVPRHMNVRQYVQDQEAPRSSQ